MSASDDEMEEAELLEEAALLEDAELLPRKVPKGSADKSQPFTYFVSVSMASSNQSLEELS